MAHSAYRMARFAYPNSAVRFTFEPCTTPKPTPLPVRHRRFASTTIARRDPTESDVQIEILFCGICHSDLHQVRNEWSGVMPTVYPCVPGHEIVGRVTKVGPAVTKFKVGDLAAVGCLVDSDGTCPDCKQGFEQFCPNLTLTCNFPDKHTGRCKTRATASIRFSRRRVTSSPATISTAPSWN